LLVLSIIFLHSTTFTLYVAVNEACWRSDWAQLDQHVTGPAVPGEFTSRTVPCQLPTRHCWSECISPFVAWKKESFCKTTENRLVLSVWLS